MKMLLEHRTGLNRRKGDVSYRNNMYYHPCPKNLCPLPTGMEEKRSARCDTVTHGTLSHTDFEVPIYNIWKQRAKAAAMAIEYHERTSVKTTNRSELTGKVKSNE